MEFLWAVCLSGGTLSPPRCFDQSAPNFLGMLGTIMGVHSSNMSKILCVSKNLVAHAFLLCFAVAAISAAVAALETEFPGAFASGLYLHQSTHRLMYRAAT